MKAPSVQTKNESTLFVVTSNEHPVRIFKYHGEAEHFLWQQESAAGWKIEKVPYVAGRSA